MLAVFTERLAAQHNVASVPAETAGSLRVFHRDVVEGYTVRKWCNVLFKERLTSSAAREEHAH